MSTTSVTGTLSSAGIGSGLDINSLVSQLVAAERAAPDQRISDANTKLTTQFSALSTLKAAMASFQSALTTLNSADSFNARKVTVGDSDYFTATADSSASAGTYQVEVVQLATAARLGSDVYADGASATVGTGTLTISVGGKSFDVAVTSKNDQLSQIRDAINSASDNTGVNASLITDSTGSYLVLTGTSTGAANSISVSATGADAGMTQLVQGLQTADADRDITAQDAIVNFSGYEIHSATNTVTDAIDGVTLNLKEAESGKKISMIVARDDDTILSRAQNFVSAYNVLAQQISTLSSYDSTTQTAGPLLGDSMLQAMQARLQRTLSSAVAGTSGAYTTLASLGITTTADGTLTLDSTKFNKALSSNPDAVSRIFSSDSGVAVTLADFMDQQLSSTGQIATRTTSITSQQKDLADQQDALDARMEVIQNRYMTQFTALDTMLSQLQSTSSYLTTQLSSLQSLADYTTKG